MLQVSTRNQLGFTKVRLSGNNCFMCDKEPPKDIDGIIRYNFDLLYLHSWFELVVSRIAQHISHDIL